MRQNSLTHAIRKTEIATKDLDKTLKITSNTYNELLESETAFKIAQESWTEQGKRNLNEFLQGWIKVIASIEKSVFGVVAAIYNYIDSFWYFGEGNKNFLVMKKEAVATILDAEI